MVYRSTSQSGSLCEAAFVLKEHSETGITREPSWAPRFVVQQFVLLWNNYKRTKTITAAHYLVDNCWRFATLSWREASINNKSKKACKYLPPTLQPSLKHHKKCVQLHPVTARSWPSCNACTFSYFFPRKIPSVLTDERWYSNDSHAAATW